MTDHATMVIYNASKVISDPLRELRIAMFRALNRTEIINLRITVHPL